MQLEGEQTPGGQNVTPSTDEGEASEPQTGGRDFRGFGLEPDVVEALDEMGITIPTPIQEKVIEPILQGKDVIGKAETGTGKTIGFGAPLIGKIDPNRVSVQCLVLTPTRELAQQVSIVLEELGKRRGLKVAMVVGGVHASEQVLRLRMGCQVVVGTPGRLLDFLKERTLSLVWCSSVVIDEADRLFDMGFIDEVRAILDKVPSERQTLLFSATIPTEINSLMKTYMREPEIHSTARGLATVTEIHQVYREVGFPQKFKELCAILDATQDETCIIFCNTRRQAIDLDRLLWGNDYPARALHGEHEQELRFKILESFRSREIRILVATDVASRGLDIEQIGRVINYEVPNDSESYVHRIGRTGRASQQGQAITLVAPKEAAQWRRILADTGFSIVREKAVTSGRPGDRGAAGGGRGRERPARERRRPPEAESGRGEKPERDAQGRRRRRRRTKPREEKSRDGAAAAPAGAAASPARPGEETGSSRGPAKRSRAPRGGSRRKGSPKGSPGGREDALFENPLKVGTDARVGPVSADVDLFDISMKEFLDSSLEIDDFTDLSEEEKRKIQAEQARRTPSTGGDQQDPARKKRRRRPRKSKKSSESGEGRPRAGEKAAAGTASGESGSTGRARGRRRRRRRRSKDTTG